MRLLLLIIFSLLTTLMACDNASQNAKTDKAETAKSEAQSVESKSIDTMSLLRHVVLFNFNDDATEEVVSNIEQNFAGLKDKISEIHDFEWGTNNSPEGLDKGLTHCFFVTFLSEDDRAAYLPHPAHKEFVELIGPYVEDVTVVDYWTK